MRRLRTKSSVASSPMKSPRAWLSFGALLGFIVTAPAAVTTDSTLRAGQAIAPVNGDFAIPASLGRIVDKNLFLSFSEFNLTMGESATFSDASNSGIGRILARVTGGPSMIDGTIRSTIAGANMVFINPQ